MLEHVTVLSPTGKLGRQTATQLGTCLSPPLIGLSILQRHRPIDLSAHHRVNWVEAPPEIMLSASWRGLAVRAVARPVSSAVPKASRTFNCNLKKLSNPATCRYSSTTTRNATREIVSQALRSIGSVSSLSEHTPLSSKGEKGLADSHARANIGR